MFCGLLFYSEKMADNTSTNVAGIIIFFCCFVVVRVAHAILKVTRNTATQNTRRQRGKHSPPMRRTQPPRGAHKNH